MNYNVTAWGSNFGPETAVLSQDRVEFLANGFLEIFGVDAYRHDGIDESITVETYSGSDGFVAVPIPE